MSVWFHQAVTTSSPIPTWVLPLGCLLVAMGITMPVWVADVPSLIGHWDALDLAGSAWAHWWTADALRRFVSPFEGTHSYFPMGLEPLLQYNLLDAVVGAPWVWLAGPRVGYNLAVIAALVGTGLSGMWLARSIGISRAGALVCGISIEASSYVGMELYEGRISQALLVFWLLGLGGLVRILRGEGGHRLAICTGLAAAAAALVYWYHGAAWILGALVLVAVSARQIAHPVRLRLATAAVVALAITLPFVLALLGAWELLPGVTRVVEDPLAVSNADSLKTGLAIASEHGRWPLWPVIGRPGQEMGHQLSLVILGLSALAFRAKTPGRWRWFVVAMTGWVLALGPVLHGWSEPTGIALPFRLLHDHIPTFDRMWWPQRFELLTVVGTAVLAGMGTEALLKRRASPRAWLGVLIALSLVDAPLRSGVVPIKASPAPVTYPDLYEGLEGPLLTVPVLPTAEISNRALYNQTQHGQPIMHGDGEHIPAHRPPGFTTLVEENDLLSALHELHRKARVDRTIQPEAVDALIEAGFVYAVADPAVYPDKDGRNWATTHGRIFKQLFGAPMRVGHSGGVWRIVPIDQAQTVRVRLATGRERQIR